MHVTGGDAKEVLASSGSDEEPVDQIATEILRYLKRNPEARDTAEGVLRWWLVEYRYEIALRKTEQALQRLVEQGEVTTEADLAGGVLYSKAPKSPGSGSKKTPPGDAQ